MSEIFGVPIQAFMGQVTVGLINGSFYALLSLGLAIIFGLLRMINVAHGAQYMLGAFAAYFLLAQLGIGYWASLVVAPLIVAAIAAVIERTMLSRLYSAGHFYSFLLTFGLALIIEGLFRHWYGSSGEHYPTPELLRGVINLGFLYLPYYRAWVVVASIVICLGTWLLIEKTRLGSYLRAATENPSLVQSFGINVPRMMTATYALGAGLAALAGVLAAPIYQVNPIMGSNILIIIFAVVVVGGMGSIAGAVITGYLLGIAEGLTKVFYPEASAIVIFVIMAIVLLLKPSGLFGQSADALGAVATDQDAPEASEGSAEFHVGRVAIGAVLLILLLIAPTFLYPVFLMKVLCFGLFALAFNLLMGYAGMVSLGHAAFFGGGAYVTAHAIKEWGVTPEIGILLGTAGAAFLGLAMGLFAIRRSGIAFVMITLALAQLVYFLSVQSPLTHGEDGIQAVPRGKLLGLVDLSSNESLYYFVLAIFLAGLFAIWRIVHSPFGNVLQAIRDNEPRAISLGYRVNRYKLAVFVMSAALAGLAGSTKVMVFQIATLTDVEWHTSGQVILMTLLGGTGTFLGPILGAGLVVSLENYLAASTFPVPVILGAIFVVCVLLFRRGILGELRGWAGRSRNRREPPGPRNDER